MRVGKIVHRSDEWGSDWILFRVLEIVRRIDETSDLIFLSRTYIFDETESGIHC